MDFLFCGDCEYDVTFSFEYAYMVRNDLWEESGGRDKVLCVSCLEKRIERILSPADFPPEIPLNFMSFCRSIKLQERMGKKDYIVVKCNSHRARKKMYIVLEEEPQSYYSWKREGEFYKLLPSAAKIALEITGITKSKDKDDLNKHMSW